jgi:division protein CdvB (Snf7/Vps24/ESCRT-III family)
LSISLFHAWIFVSIQSLILRVSGYSIVIAIEMLKMTDTIKNWERKPSFIGKVKGRVTRGPPLRERLSFTIYRLRVQQNKLEQSYLKMRHHYDDLFGKCTDAVVGKDRSRATLFANECAEVKKMVSTILQSQLAIEQVIMRLETIHEFGDIAADLGPVMSVIGSLRGRLSGILPDVSYKLGEIGESINGMVMEAGYVSGSGWDVGASAEADKILGEANVIAEQKMKEKFPTLPADIPSIERAGEPKI